MAASSNESCANEKCYYMSNIPDTLEKCSLLNRKDVTKFRDIRGWILDVAKLEKGVKLDNFKKFLHHLSFQHNAKERKKLRAVITGSYPATKAGSIARYRDIDIWIFWNHRYHPQDEWIKLLYLIDPDLTNDYDSKIPGLLKIGNIGRIQFLVIFYEKKSEGGDFEEDCLCDYHIQKCFPDSHNVTRYRLIVFENYKPINTRLRSEKVDLAIPVYIPYNEDSTIIAKCTSLEGCKDGDIYPGKHLLNSPSLSPPTLYYQAMLNIGRKKGENIDSAGHWKKTEEKFLGYQRL